MKTSEKTILSSIQKFFKSKKDIFFAPEDAWVELGFPESPSLEHNPEEVTAGVETIRLDQQHLAFSNVRGKYFYSEKRALNSFGTSQISEIEIKFMPIFQKVVIHKIQVHRNEEIIDKIPTAHLQIAQNDRITEEGNYQGFKYLSLIISDVQVGDKLECSYTIYGSDPAAGNHFGDRITVGFFSPVGYQRVRILMPRGKELFIRNYKHDYQPSIKESLAFPEAKEYVWDIFPQETCKFELKTPSWYCIKPYIEVSDFSSWQEVVDTFLPYFTIHNESNVLGSTLQEIKTRCKTPKERAVACLEYVQRKIRYRSSRETHLTYKPAAVEETLKNGFGDCKDKTLLLLYMLKYLKIEAYPALISSKAASLKEALPSLKAFDHVLVYAMIGSRGYWLDPTYRYQEGEMDVRYTLSDDYALILRKAEERLIWIPKSDFSYKEIKEIFDFREKDSDFVPLDVEMICHGFTANGLRGQIEEKSLASLVQSYTQFYEANYPGAKRTKNIELQDDKKANLLSLKESYLLEKDQAFQKEEAGFLFTACDLRDYLNFLPQETTRIHPFEISYPLHVKHTLEVLLPRREGKAEFSKKSVCDEAFELESVCEDRGDKVIICFTYKTLKDHVFPERLQEFQKNLDAAYDMVSRVIPFR